MAILCPNNFLYSDNITCALKKNIIRVIITNDDKTLAHSKIVLDKSVSLPLFIIILLIILPVAFFVSLIWTVFNKEKEDYTYDKIKEHFKNGKGYLNNLSDDEKKKLLIKTNGIPLGL